MPFDGSDSTPALNRARLVAALRAPMPAHFKWDFLEIEKEHSCGTVGCAMGLAKAIGIFDGPSVQSWTETIAPKLGITHQEASDIFLGLGDFYGNKSLCDITPQLVADALEAVG